MPDTHDFFGANDVTNPLATPPAPLSIPPHVITHFDARAP